MDSNEKQRQRELDLRRENEKKDLEVERTIGPRPLEGMSGGHTTWTGEQNDAERSAHSHDEERSRRASEEQIPD
ncbi:MAG TPA: hypothetical protein VFK85_15715 [Anaeromyxobacteraceae bacterium]|nr:hypothetical protein [Anaeromyxobacteraceae bacterium]